MSQQYKGFSYDSEANAGYIFLVEPQQTLNGSDDLSDRHYDIIIDFGEEVPVLGIEFVFRNASKLANLDTNQKLFTQKGNTFSLRVEDKPVQKSVQYEGIPEVQFLFADEEAIDFIGIDVCSDNPYYHEYLSKN